jgi:hypothetical protein
MRRCGTARENASWKLKGYKWNAANGAAAVQLEAPLVVS